jgi:F-type H+-transporting ATPase subunit b
MHLFAADTGTPNPLVPSLAEIIVGLIAFAILYFVVAKFLVPRFEQMYKERTDAIEGGMARAQEAQEQAAAALANYQAQLADARGEAARIREEGREQGAAILAEMREQAQSESARIVAAAQVQVEAERLAAMASLRHDVGTLASDLAAKIVGQELSDDDAKRAVIDRFIADLEANASQGV